MYCFALCVLHLHELMSRIAECRVTTRKHFQINFGVRIVEGNIFAYLKCFNFYGGWAQPASVKSEKDIIHQTTSLLQERREINAFQAISRFECSKFAADQFMSLLFCSRQTFVRHILGERKNIPNETSAFYRLISTFISDWNTPPTDGQMKNAGKKF